MGIVTKPPGRDARVFPVRRIGTLFGPALAAALALSALWLAAPGLGQSEATMRVLVFTRTTGFRHDSIPAGVAALQELGATHGVAVDHTEDAGRFTDAGLQPYRAVVFLSTTGDVLDADQQVAFERYIRAGGGFVGIHAASDTEFDWPWYGDLVGAYFASHPEVQPAILHVEDRQDPSTSGLPDPWERTDEWYDFRTNPRDNGAHVLLTLDERSYTGGRMGVDHPITWFHAYDGGRAWYTGGGHTSDSFAEPLFRAHLWAGVVYAAALPPADALVVFGGRDTSAWQRAADGGPIVWRVLADGSLEVEPGAGDIQTGERFDDFQLHLEFWVPATPSDWPDQTRGNSGLYLQGRYELQILDSFEQSTGSRDGAGALYSMQDPTVNAARPPATWQTYDVTFRAARFGPDGARRVPARVDVWWNSIKVHDSIELAGPTPGGAPETNEPGPIRLQDHGDRVRFRNVWVRPLPPES
jgi:type 1 glutamine amidotransferase